MDAWVWIVLLAVVLVIVAAAAWWFIQQRRSRQLRQQFGPEYDRAVGEVGDRRRAEAELEARRRRVEQLDIRPLAPADSARFTEAWRAAQARFVDDPPGAIADADRLIAEVMRERGYPVGDFEERASVVSVDHPRVVENYRAAHGIALRSKRGEADTEDLRKAMVHYRSLFAELLETAKVE